MENQITPTVPTDSAASPFKKVIIALTALLVVGGVGATVYLNMGTGQGDPNEPPPSLSVAGGGLKGSFADEGTQGFLQYEAKDVTEFEKEKASLASKWGAAGVVKAGVNFYAINTDGLTMADLVKSYNPKQDGNRALFVIYSAGQYMNGTTPLVKGFHTYPAGPFGAATNEIKKDDLPKINLPRNSGVIIISRAESENNGILHASIAPAGKITGPLLADDKSGWVLVSGNGKLADILGAEKSRVVSAWGLKNASEFEKVDLNTYEFSTYHVAWLNVGKKSSVSDTPAASPTPPGPAPTITKIEPATAEQGQKGVTFIITGTNLAGATVSFTPSTDFKNITGLTIDTTNTSVKFIADIDDNAKADEFKEIKLTTTAGSVSDKTKFKVTAKVAAKPVLTAISTTEGEIDKLINIVITGENIANINNLKIGNVTAQTVFTDVAGGKKEAVFTLLDTVPVGSQDLVVVSPAGTSNALKFNVKPSTTSMVGKDVLVQYSPNDKKTFTNQWFEAKITKVTPTEFLGIKLNSYDITYKYPIKRNASNNSYYALTTGPGSLVTNLAAGQIATPADATYLDEGKDFLVVIKQPGDSGWSAKLNGKNSTGKYSITYTDQTDAKERDINNIYRPLASLKIPVESVAQVPAGAITDKGSDTTLPKIFTFISPTQDQVWALESVLKNGIDFYGNDPNTKSHLKAADGKFYMSYAWELKKGNEVVWESGWSDGFAENPTGKNCVINVTNHEGNKTNIWSCPSAVIPAAKLAGITGGTYTLTGWVGDSKQSPEPTSVTFKIEGTPAAAADTSGVKVGDTVLGKFKDGFQWFPGKVSKVTTTDKTVWPGIVVGKVTSYSIDYDDGGKETSLSVSQVALFAEHPASVKEKQKVIIESPNTPGTYWNATVKLVEGKNVTVTYDDEVKDAKVDISKVWVSLAGEVIASDSKTDGNTLDDKIFEDLKNIEITMNIPEVDTKTGDTKLSFKFSPNKLSGPLYDTNNGGKIATASITAAFDSTDVTPMVKGDNLYQQNFQSLSNLLVGTPGSTGGGKIPCAYWEGESLCAPTDRYLPTQKSEVANAQTLALKPRVVTISGSDKSKHTIKISLFLGTDSKRKLVKDYTFDYQQGTAKLEIVSLSQTYVVQECPHSTTNCSSYYPRYADVTIKNSGTFIIPENEKVDYTLKAYNIANEEITSVKINGKDMAFPAPGKTTTIKVKSADNDTWVYDQKTGGQFGGQEAKYKVVKVALYKGISQTPITESPATLVNKQ